MAEKVVKLINKRGRIVRVSPDCVQRLLARGFLKAPEQVHEYNPVFDRGGQNMAIVTKLKDRQEKSGQYREYLEVTRI